MATTEDNYFALGGTYGSPDVLMRGRPPDGDVDA